MKREMTDEEAAEAYKAECERLKRLCLSRYPERGSIDDDFEEPDPPIQMTLERQRRVIVAFKKGYETDDIDVIKQAFIESFRYEPMAEAF